MTSGTPLVSFVLLSYNYARYIGETISSVLAHTGARVFADITNIAVSISATEANSTATMPATGTSSCASRVTAR